MGIKFPDMHNFALIIYNNGKYTGKFNYDLQYYVIKSTLQAKYIYENEANIKTWNMEQKRDDLKSFIDQKFWNQDRRLKGVSETLFQNFKK